MSGTFLIFIRSKFTIVGMKNLADKIILASASPRRKELLERENFNFTAVNSNAKEADQTDSKTFEIALGNAVLKAENVAEKFPNNVVLGSDTIVVFNDKVFGKPKDLADAKRMLKILQGNVHSVYTAIAIVQKSKGILDASYDESKVEFKPMSDEQICDYLSKVNVLDKAGAYAAQEFGELIIKRIDGEFDNVMGLPCKLLKNRLDYLFLNHKNFLKK